MMSLKWILLVLEDGVFRDESVCYAIKLAERINCSISVLMLVDNSDYEADKLNNSGKIIQIVLGIIRAKGINTMGKIRYGDKASEFIKHLALNSQLEAIIWGGKEESITGSKKKKSEHWFAKVKSNVPYPVVRPEIRDKSKKLIKQKESK
jgi:hypothetical protein